MQVTAEDIKVFSRLVHDLCGVVLDASKAYLIESRLSGIAREAGCKTFSELYYRIRYGNDKTLTGKVIDAITTHETLFFRDTSPFEALQHKVLPDLIDARAGSPHPQRLRIWSAACSTGQEVYSIAMVLAELLRDLSRWDIRILGTDISDGSIRTASLGRYAEIEIRRGMKPELLARYFVREGTTWRVRDELRAIVSFRQLNLLRPFAGLGPFDIIFCRNVSIYFTPEARRDMFMRLIRELTPDGYLFVGSSESLTDLGPQFTPHHHCRAIFYRPNLTPGSSRPAAFAHQTAGLRK